MSNLVESELSGLTKALAKAGTMGSSSFQSGCSKDDGGNCSQTTSIYGSHISSWVEHGQSMRHNGSVSTAHSKKKDETTKSNRKRMIQDQVKELQEIVPNGAKCSIDALLERTIKHMLFLQSVTKHSDKLKQTGESKIISKEGGLLSKDKFEGGATWSFEDGCMRPPSGDDLLDNLGADFKKKLLIGKWDNLPADEQRMGEVNMSNLVESELCGLTKSLAKAGTMGSSSFQSGCSKDDGGNRSQTTSIYGSHISSWVEHGQSMRQDGSVSTAHSKKKDETTKSNHKRMIQDQVKELREIVPNGAKCSIDALLEHTIKHMLFLQSVTKHADKLKKTGESKIISKEGGLLLKDKFEGGATRAFEVGLQSMVCPIIVEDLNPPRQLLVEMLCEERGSFLEIADLIRGLGLTILTGVMEARNDKIWARFAVEP